MEVENFISGIKKYDEVMTTFVDPGHNQHKYIVQYDRHNHNNPRNTTGIQPGNIKPPNLLTIDEISFENGPIPFSGRLRPRPPHFSFGGFVLVNKL
jgi:hypothetical protein